MNHKNLRCRFSFFIILIFINCSCGFFRGSIARNQCAVSGAFPIPQFGAPGFITFTQDNQHIIVDSQRNVIVGGYTSGTSGTVYGTHGTSDTLTLKYNSSGALQWASQVGVAGSDTYESGVYADNSGNIFTAGYTAGVIGTQYGTHSSLLECYNGLYRLVVVEPQMSLLMVLV
jgi:hypothetical protein